jgi:nucleoid-associated protein YgaU
MPTRPVGTADRAVRLVTSGSVPRTSEVVVHRGDTLWDIARRHLGPGASDAEVAAAWPRWYATNQHVIGPDPDVLLPGQVLRAPEPSPPGGPGVGARR